MTESWTRDGVNTDQAVTNYTSHQNATPRTVTITLPNGTKSVQYSHNAPGSFLDGLVYSGPNARRRRHTCYRADVTWARAHTNRRARRELRQPMSAFR